MPDLEAGVYHFGAHDFSAAAVAAGRLSRRDCEGDGRAERDERACDDHLRGNILAQRTVSGADLSPLGWDNGTMLANLLATATALNLPARIVTGFVDEDVNRLLALDTDREVAFSMVSLLTSSHAPGRPPTSDDWRWKRSRSA